MAQIIPLTNPYILYNERKMLNFCSSDYLGLSENNEIKQNALKFTVQCGTTLASTFAPGGILPCQIRLQEKLASLLGTQSTSLFPTFFQAQMAILSEQPLVLIDRGCQRSWFQAVTCSGAPVKIYEHNDLDHLAEILERSQALPHPSKIIISETLFGASGDFCPMAGLHTLAKQHEALLCLDDSYALGVLGKEGMGLAAQKGFADLIIGNFAHACASQGAYIASAQEIASHALVPSIIGSLDATLDAIEQMEGERQELAQKAAWLRRQVHDLTSCSHIITLPPEENLTEQLFDADILVNSTIALTINHLPEHLELLLDQLLRKSVLIQ